MTWLPCPWPSGRGCRRVGVSALLCLFLCVPNLGTTVPPWFSIAAWECAVTDSHKEDLVNTFGSSWREEQEKQQHISNRLKADVPLLVLKPRSLQEADLGLRRDVGLFQDVAS